MVVFRRHSAAAGAEVAPIVILRRAVAHRHRGLLFYSVYSEYAALQH